MITIAETQVGQPTEGEWSVNLNHAYEISGVVEVCADLHNPIAITLFSHKMTSVGEQLANAHIMAAAKELLVELVNARQTIEGLHAGLSFATDEIPKTLARIDDVIAKAKGKV